MESIIGAVFRIFTIFVCLAMIVFSLDAHKENNLGITLFFLVVLIIAIFI